MAETPDASSWQQVLWWIGVALAGGASWLLGTKKKDKAPEDIHYDNAQEQLNLLQRQLERSQTTDEIRKLNDTLSLVMGAMREAIIKKIDDNMREVNSWKMEVESRVAVLEDRNERVDRNAGDR